MDELRDHNYHPQQNLTREVALTNHAIKAHIVRAYYATYVMTSILSANTIELNPLLYGFEEEDERLHPDKAIRPIPKEYAVHCTCLKCATEIYVHVERVTCLVASSSSSKVWETRRFAVKIQLVISKTEQNSYMWHLQLRGNVLLASTWIPSPIIKLAWFGIVTTVRSIPSFGYKNLDYY